MMIRRNALAVAILLAGGLAACGNTNPVDAVGSAQGVTLDLQPLQAQVQPGGAVAFLGAVTGTADVAVTWEVVEAGGGSIDASGHYSAPQATGQYHVRAVSHADPTVLSVATVSVVATPVVGVSVSPASPSVATGGSVTFAASVTGSSDTTVNWTVQETSGCGAISSSGVYTAPGTAGTCHVVATSRADTTKRATATVTVTAVTPPPPPPPPSGPLPACATAPLRTTGPVYYYCDCGTGAAAGCVAGNDANAGTSPSAPRMSLGNAAARFNGMNAGSTVALCRGGAWSGGFGGLHNSSCGTSETTYCDLREYVPSWGSSSTARPRLNGAGTGFINLTTGQGYRFWNLDIRGAGDGDNGIFYVNIDGSGVHDVDACNIQVDGGRLHFNIVRGNLRGTSNFVVRNSQFYRANFSSFYGGMDGLTVDQNHFEDNHRSASTATGGTGHTVYFAEGADGIRFTNNYVTTSPSQCSGVQVVFHQAVPNMLVENNFIYSAATSANVNVNGGHGGNCYGIQLSAGAAGGFFPNAIIRRNRIFRVPGAGSTGNTLEVTICPNCTITDNIAVGGNFYVGGSSTTNNIVQNNSLYLTGMTVQGTGHTVQNNAVTGACSLSGTDVSNNVCNVNASAAWTNPTVDPASANFTPVNAGPLVGAASQTNYSPTAVDSVTWNPSDSGLARVPPISAGAMQR